MTKTQTTEVKPAGNGNFTIVCTCGEKVTYAGEAFTQIEAQRHAAWHVKVGR